MIVSPALEKSEQKILRLDGCRLNKIPSIKMKRYLAYHRDKLGHQEGEFEKIGVQRLLHDQRQPVKARRMSVWPVASQTRHS
jgi:hypothetical protein